MTNQEWYRATLKRKPISINRSKTKETENTSSVVLDNGEEKRNEVYFNSIKNQRVNINGRKVSVSLKPTERKRRNELLSNVKKDMSNLAYSTIDYSGENGSQASVSLIKAKVKIEKTSLKVIAKTPKGIIISYKGVKRTYRKIKVAPRKTVNAVKQIKVMPKRVTNTIKNIPIRTVKIVRNVPNRVKRGTINVVKAVPKKTFSTVRNVPGKIGRGVGKSVNYMGNSLSNSNDIGIKSIGYSMKTTQYTVRVTKAVKNVIQSVTKKGFIKLLAPAIAFFVIVATFWNNVDAIATAIAELLQPHEPYHQVELSVLSKKTASNRAGLVDDLNNTVIANLPNPFFPSMGYHVFYFKTGTGLYVPLEKANEYFLSVDGFKNLIKPLLHISLLIDFDCEFDRVYATSPTVIFKDNYDNFIRGANYEIMANGKFDEISYNFNKLYGIYGWTNSEVKFEDYVEIVYDMIWENVATVVTEPLPTEWCESSEDVDSGNPYAKVSCLNHTDTLTHADDLSVELNSCDYYYYLCNGSHSVLSCKKTIHAHSDSCRGCGKEEHSHVDSCRGCGKEEHSHVGECYGQLNYGGWGIKCGYEEHTHTVECNTCGIEEHTHTVECNTCGIEEHFYHGEDCYKMEYHNGQLASDCGYSTKHKGCNGYQLCLGHRVLAIGLDYASLEELEQEYIISRIEDMELISWENEAIRLINYYEFYLDSKDERFD